MTRLVLLDAGPVGLLTRSPRVPEAAACYAWLRAQLASGTRVLLPEIADYEVRRELLRLQARAALRRLDALQHEAVYLPLNTPVMQHAAELWAQMRQAERSDKPGAAHREDPYGGARGGRHYRNVAMRTLIGA